VPKKGYCCGVSVKQPDTKAFKLKILLPVGRMDSHCTSHASCTNISCALIDRYRPDLLQYSTLQRHNHRRNFELAFEAAEKIDITV
jgi:hypothetical protein